MAVTEKIRVRLKSYDHTLIDTAAEKIVDVAKKNGATVSGPIPLPTEKEIITILRAPAGPSGCKKRAQNVKVLRPFCGPSYSSAS